MFLAYRPDWHQLGQRAPATQRSPSSPEGVVPSIAFDPTGTYVAGGSEDGLLRIWRVADGRLVRSRSLPLGEGGWPAVVWGRRAVRAFSGWGELHQLTWPRGRWESRSIEPDTDVIGGAGDTLLYRSQRDGTLWLVRPGRPGRIGPIVVPNGWMRIPLACVPDRAGVLLRAEGGRPVLATATEQEWLPRVSDSAVITCAAADGDQVVVGTADGDVFLRSGSKPWRRLASIVGAVAGVAISVAGDHLAVGGVNHLTVLSLATGRELRRFQGPPPATDVCFRGRTVICGFADGRVARWVPGSATEWVHPPVPVLPGPWPRRTTVRVDRDHAVTRHDGALVVWSIEDGRLVRRTEAVQGLDSWYDPILRWPWLALTSPGLLRIWNLETGTREERPLDIERARPVVGPGARVLVQRVRQSDTDAGLFAWWGAAGDRWVLLNQRPDPARPATLRAGWRGLAAAAWTASGILLVTDDDWIGRMRSTGDDHLLAAFPGGIVSAADMDDVGAVALAVSYPPVLFHLDGSGAHLRALWRFAGHVPAVAIADDGSRVAAACADGSVVVVHLEDGRTDRLRGLVDA